MLLKIIYLYVPLRTYTRSVLEKCLSSVKTKSRLRSKRVCKPTTSGSGINEYWKSLDIKLALCEKRLYPLRSIYTFNILPSPGRRRWQYIRAFLLVLKVFLYLYILFNTYERSSIVIYYRSVCSSGADEVPYNPSKSHFCLLLLFFNNNNNILKKNSSPPFVFYWKNI